MTTAALLPSVAEFIGSPKRLLIDGEWQDAADGRTFATIDPATEATITQVAHAGTEDVNRAVLAARRAFEHGSAWSRFTPRQRGRLLWKIADLLEENADEFAQLEALDGGKPFIGARDGDVATAAELFRYFAGWTNKIEGTTIPLSSETAQFHAYTVREPIGVVAGIVPWNFPLTMAAFKIVPAITVGNTVILKPAEQTPLSALRLGELMLEAGLPAGVVNVLPGFGDTGAALVDHIDVDKVAFTGSTSVGKKIAAAASRNLKKVSLELGGKAPNIVFNDADLAKAIPGSAHAAFFNQGQCCCAGSRLFVEEKIRDEFVSKLAAKAGQRRVGNQLDEKTEQGPQVSQEQLDKILGYVELGPRACRVDLAERAAQALLDGATEVDALRCLSIPRRDAAGVARAVREQLSPPRAGAA